MTGLPAQIANYTKAAADTGLRVGVVTRFDSSAITVRISGADTLVDATYLSSYTPVLGDIVAVQHQGATWLVLGGFAGMPADNPVVNPSFEDGTSGGAVPNWTNYHNAGTSTIIATVETTDLTGASSIRPVDGAKAMRIFVSAAIGAGLDTSFEYTSSEPIPVVPGEKWSASGYMIGGHNTNTSDGLSAAGAILLTWYAASTDTYPTTSAADSLAGTPYTPLTPPWIIVNTPGEDGGIEVPAGANFMRVTLNTGFAVEKAALTSNGVFSVYWDRIVARHIT